MNAESAMSGYMIAWIIYLVAASGLLLVFWRMTRGLKTRRTRRVLRAIVATVLLTPVNIAPEGLWLSPAYLVAGYDLVQGHMETATRAGLHLAIGFAALIALMLIESIGRRVFGLSRSY